MMDMFGTPTSSASEGRVLAQVNGKPITQADVERFLMASGTNADAYRNNPKGLEIVLDHLIAQKLFLLDAQRNLMEREPAFKERLAAIKDQLLTEYAVAKVVEPIRVTEEEARAYYDQHPEEFAGQETVNASHILVDTREKAADILTRIRAGEISFEDAAAQYSSCPSSAQGGNLGDFSRGQMVPEFDAACFSMDEGQLSDPIQTQFGFHIIQLNRKNAPTPHTYASIRAQLMEQLRQIKQQQAYQKKVNQLKILYPVDRL